MTKGVCGIDQGNKQAGNTAHAACAKTETKKAKTETETRERDHLGVRPEADGPRLGHPDLHAQNTMQMQS